jgi:hypothetical protein
LTERPFLSRSGGDVIVAWFGRISPASRLGNPVADQPAHFAERRFELAIMANQFYRELIKRAGLTSLNPAQRCHATAATENRLEILIIQDASLLYFPEQIKAQADKNYSAYAIYY